MKNTPKQPNATFDNWMFFFLFVVMIYSFWGIAAMLSVPPSPFGQ